MKTFQQMAIESRAQGITKPVSRNYIPPTKKFDTVAEMVTAYAGEFEISEQDASAIIRKDCYPGNQGKACRCILWNPKNARSAYWGYVQEVLNW